jgi:3beta-hydroxy-delta5-steroid dehydrogenase/steroid delta-isomerase
MGYLGRRLARELVRRGWPTRVLDRRGPERGAHDPGVEVVRGDVRNPDDVGRACAGIDTVFHCAGVIVLLRLARRRVREECRAINVDGCRNVLEAAIAAGVRRFVYTSSTNVALGTDAPEPGEPAGYSPGPHDLYTETKIAAERMVLAADGRGGIRTCAVRPGGIWGPDDPRIVDRVAAELRRGRLRWRIGAGHERADHTYVDNAVDGHIAAALCLVPGSPACGQAWDVTDGRPASTIEFLRPLIEGLGHPLPHRRLPLPPLLAVAWIGEAFHACAGLGLPPLTTGELRRSTTSDAASPERTRVGLGWAPPIARDEAWAVTVAHCRRHVAARPGPTATADVDRPHWLWWVLLPGGMAALGALALMPTLHALSSRHLISLPPRWALGLVFAWAAVVHVYKGLRAARLASSAGLSPAGWGWQTFVLGFASMRLLRRRIAERTSRGDVSP